MGANSGTGFWLVWVAIGGIFFLLAFLRRIGFFERHHGFGIALAILALVSVLLIGFLCVRIVGAFSAKPPKKLDCVLVLGTQVYANGPSTLLAWRLDTAAAYLKENPETLCIVSGGQGYNEPCAEAEVMYTYLVEHGISGNRILRETRSKNTTENIRFSKELLPEGYETIGIVTNDFHVYRAVKLAEAGGLHGVYGVSAPSVASFLPNNMFRECLALIKDKLAGNF